MAVTPQKARRGSSATFNPNYKLNAQQTLDTTAHQGSGEERPRLRKLDAGQKVIPTSPLPLNLEFPPIDKSCVTINKTIGEITCKNIKSYSYPIEIKHHSDPRTMIRFETESELQEAKAEHLAASRVVANVDDKSGLTGDGRAGGKNRKNGKRRGSLSSVKTHRDEVAKIERKQAADDPSYEDSDFSDPPRSTPNPRVRARPVDNMPPPESRRRRISTRDPVNHQAVDEGAASPRTRNVPAPLSTKSGWTSAGNLGVNFAINKIDTLSIMNSPPVKGHFSATKITKKRKIYRNTEHYLPAAPHTSLRPRSPSRPTRTRSTSLGTAMTSPMAHQACGDAPRLSSQTMVSPLSHTLKRELFGDTGGESIDDAAASSSERKGKKTRLSLKSGHRSQRETTLHHTSDTRSSRERSQSLSSGTRSSLGRLRSVSPAKNPLTSIRPSTGLVAYGIPDVLLPLEVIYQFFFQQITLILNPAIRRHSSQLESMGLSAQIDNANFILSKFAAQRFRLTNNLPEPLKHFEFSEEMSLDGFLARLNSFEYSTEKTSTPSAYINAMHDHIRPLLRPITHRISEDIEAHIADESDGESMANIYRGEMSRFAFTLRNILNEAKADVGKIATPDFRAWYYLLERLDEEKWSLCVAPLAKDDAQTEKHKYLCDRPH